MIVPMKKIAVIVETKDALGAISALRHQGAVHIEHEQQPKSKDLNFLRDDLALVNQATEILIEASGERDKLELIANKIPLDWKIPARHIVDLSKRIDHLEEYSRVISQKINDWKIWGDFDPEMIKHLAGKNIQVKLYQVPRREITNFPADAIVKQIAAKQDMVYCAVISQNKIECSFKEVELPKTGLGQMQRRFAEDQRIKQSLAMELKERICYYKEFLGIKASLEKEIEFHEALSGMAQIGDLTYLKGYLPFDAEQPMLQLAKKERWGILITQPSEEDSPPTLLRNPHWIRLIEPVLKMLGISPGYRELDVSPALIVFFSIFFGILIGDAGYGLVYLLLTFYFQKKKGINARNADIFYLFYILSSCAIIWGILTGTFFGQGWLASRGIKPLLPALNKPEIMQKFCFFIGALHLSIAHAWRGILKFPHPSCLADVGWIAVLWVSFYMAGALILGQAFPAFGLAAAVCGVILILFFSEPRKNIFKGLGAGFVSVTFGLSFMSAFTDVVSYVRLFAVGMAGVAIADTTNAMSSSLGVGGVGFIIGVLIMIVGHALNIVLGPIAILVHGVRLNVLEFGLNHVGLTWSGERYKPFQESA